MMIQARGSPLAMRAITYAATAAILLSDCCHGLSSLKSSVFRGRSLALLEKPEVRSSRQCELVMRKQKASDRRTTRRQRGLVADFDQRQLEISSGQVITLETLTRASPMEAAGHWKHKRAPAMPPVRPKDVGAPKTAATGGRGRSRKRSNLYSSISFYHNKFLGLLTTEYQSEEEEVLGRIQASVDEPLGLETAGYAFFDMYPERRGNLYGDEVYRLTKANDATTSYSRTVDQDDQQESVSGIRYLPTNHKFSTNDVIMLTLQPNGSGDFFQKASVPISDAAVTVEARVLGMGPTYLDVVMQPGSFEATFGSPAPNDKSGAGDASMRLRADRFVSNVPYQRMVSALAQLTSLPHRDQSANGGLQQEHAGDDKDASPHDRISMDEVIRDVILSTHAYGDPGSPFHHDPDFCDLQELSYRLSKPPMGNSQKLASQALKYMQSNPDGQFPELNAPQRSAIGAALTRRMTMIQGPPGSGKTTVAAAIGFGFAHQCYNLSPHTKVLATAFSNVGADNLAESLQKVGLKIVRIGKPSAVSKSLWDCTLDAAIDLDRDAQKALRNAVRATAQLGKMKVKKNRGHGASSDRALRDAATTAVKASILACNVAATRALRRADVIVTTSTGAADPRLLAACGCSPAEESDKRGRRDFQSQRENNHRTDAPDGLPPLSLPFVLVDEACQSVEPATLIPVVSTNSCRSLVMLGDPCQLPPTIRSRSATPLSESLMERLAATLPNPSVIPPVDNTAKDTTFSDALPVKQAKSLLKTLQRGEQQQSVYRKRYTGSLLLSIQYRMHPSIAAFPSSIFYDGLLATPDFMAGVRSFPRALNKMMPCGDPSMCVRMIDVRGHCNERRGMPTQYARTVFGTAMPSSQEEQTTYWNELEAHKVISLVKDVLQDPDPTLSSIGVISPYNGQVQFIKSMMARDRELASLLEQKPMTIEVTSVDGYQGRERDIIIFSAVRSNRKGNIGFLRDWRRLNVALTRARSALLVVGDFELLSDADKHWAALYKWGCGVRCVVEDFDNPDDEPSL